MSASLTIELDPSKTDLIEGDIDIFSEASFHIHIAKFSHLPWLQEIKRKAWASFTALPMPTRTDEHWRFSKLQPLDRHKYHLSHAPSEREQINLAKDSNFIEKVEGRLVFEDNHLTHYDSITAKLENQGVIWISLIEAFEEHPKLVKKYFSKQITQLGSEKFSALNIAYAHAGAFLYVPKGVQITLPLIAYHWSTDAGSAIFPHTLVIAETGAKVNLIEFYASHSPDHTALSLSVANVYSAPNALVKRKTIQNFNTNTTSFQLDTSVAERDARIETIAANLGAQYTRFENQVKIQGSGADVNLYSLSVADSHQHIDQRTHQIHNAPHATSNLLYKNALLDESRSVFSGLIIVDKAAQKTDAYQTNRNLLLSPNVEANSLPGLEIAANDVKCSHGATAAELDKNDLFYMQSRGLTRKEAEKWLTFAFFEEILKKIGILELEEKLRALIQAKFCSKNDR